MSITRRQALKTAGAAVVASSIAKPAIAQKSPIQIGYLPALTGPSSSTGVGINRGVQLAVDEINKAGGVDGRQLELISRDTQSDPTKAVNGAAELTRGHKVSVIFGPVNSGEALAVVPLLARANVPQLHPCWVDSLADAKKYPTVLPQRPDQPADRRRRQSLRGRGAEEEEGRGDQRHDRLRHGLGRRLCADAQADGRGRRLSGASSMPPIRTSSPKSCACRLRAPKRSCPGA